MGAANAAKTHCKRNHPLSGPNLYVSPRGTRACKRCRAAAQYKIDERKRAERNNLPPEINIEDSTDNPGT